MKLHSNPIQSFCGFVWCQGGADAKFKNLADDYYQTFERLVLDIRTDLSTPNLPVFILTSLNDQEIDLASIRVSKDKIKKGLIFSMCLERKIRRHVRFKCIHSSPWS